MIKRLPYLCALALAAGVLLAPATAAAGTVSKESPFALDEWIPLEVTDGAVTLHRIRISRDLGRVTKSRLMRPGSSESLVSVQIQLDYTNTSRKDWDAHLTITLEDAEGREVDTYSGKEALSDRSNSDLAVVRLATLKYALDMSKTLRLKIDFQPE